MIGFLADTQPAALLARLQELNADRHALALVRAALGPRPRRNLRDMCADYERVLNLPALSARAYFAPDAAVLRTDQPIWTVQLMWRGAGEVFTEAESTRCRIAVSGTDQVVSLPVSPRSQPPVQLRLDFGKLPGFLILSRVHLKDVVRIYVRGGGKLLCRVPEAAWKSFGGGRVLTPG